MEWKNYLTAFKTQNEYLEFIETDSFIIPNVSLCLDDNTLYYHKKKNYFTIESLEDDNQVSFNKAISYSLNDGATWNTLNANEQITVNSGNVIKFKGELTPSAGQGIGTFSASKNYNVKGNVMSLLYGDGFENKNDLTGKIFAFFNLFRSSTTLVSAENLILPATTLANNCYQFMFYCCTSLTTAPELPATTLAKNCYFSMFYGCSSLTTAPELPATILADWCYCSMLQGCTSLTVAPELPATTLASTCYSGMFRDCTSLTVAPELPATTLADNCYWSMFRDCTSLTVAPELPATTLTYSCYSNMFYGCSLLNNITMLATDISASSCLTDWVSGVSSTGVFYKNPAMASLPTGTNGIPSGWEVKNYEIDYSKKYFTIVSLEDDNQVSFDKAISYSSDNGATWNTLNSKEKLLINAGDEVYFKMTNHTIDYNIGTFSASKNYNVKGNIMSLLYGNDFKNKMDLTGKDYAFRNLFSGSTTLISAENLILPATTLAKSCYVNLFSGCKSLTVAPELPATTLTYACYSSMFYGCTSLTVAPELPATILADWCYNYMFGDCTSLAVSPELPATTLANGCYNGMFRGCSKLYNITMLATDISASDCFTYWVEGVSSTGTFYKNPDMASLPTGTDGIPSGWEVKDYGDYSKEYFTIESLEDDNQVSFNKAISYSSDNGLTWNTLNSGEKLLINSGDEIKLKGELIPLEYRGNGTFTVTKTYNVKGNIMSLLYGDDFENKIDLTGKDYTFTRLFGNSVTLVSAENLILPATTLSYYCYQSMFSGCKSLTVAPELPATTLNNSCYAGMFYGCSSLTVAPELPATTLTYSCYYNMFYGCSSLNNITMLATGISAMYCLTNWVSGVSSTGTFYKNPKMNSLPTGNSGIPSGWEVWGYGIDYKEYFTIESLEDDNQVSFTNSISYSSDNGSTWNDLNANEQITVNTSDEIKFKMTDPTISEGIGTFGASKNYNVKGNIMSLIYGDDFENKNDLTGKDYVFNALFSGSTTLISAENLILPANTLASNCYEYMFEGCTSLTVAPELPATALVDWCYSYMFDGCTSLTVAPELPATELTYGCYGGMFASCISLTVAPDLPATTLAENCYDDMFYGCTSLTVAPELPATTLAKSCYQYMFQDCTFLTVAPELPATTLAKSCYYNMFQGCTSLIVAPELPATKLAYGCYSDMFKGCTNLNNITMLATDISASFCLSNWVSGVSSTGIFYKNPDMTSLPTGNSGIPSGWEMMDYVDYSKEYFTIESLEDDNQVSFNKTISYSSDNGNTWDTLNGGEKLLINSGDEVCFKMTYPTIGYGIGTFSASKKYNVKGNVMSLLYGDDFENKTDLTDKSSAFRDLFRSSTTLVSAEDLILPATTLASNCYFSMFYGCSSLTVAPELPATTLGIYCCQSMFEGCTSLTVAPELPATKLAYGCYQYMFKGCTSLTVAPELPATTLDEWCYYQMFKGCTSLTVAPELPATTLGNDCYSSMFEGCSSLTVAPELPATTLAKSCYYQMFKGCASLTVAPELPATALKAYCYESMFGGCTSLNNITMLATDISARDCLSNWVSGVSSSGTFYKNPAMTSLPTGDSGIPSGWEVRDYGS